jgi:aspartyl-tRNA(Asn)/glutamyl-tRNA(Gln) amidotransferase subunit A
MPVRFKDWPLIDAADRKLLGALVSARARALEPDLNAYALIRSESEGPAEDALKGGLGGALGGALGGMPYAAKDIFAAPDRRPCGGLQQPQIVRESYADALRLLDEAGGLRIGYTALTELAYEPSGYNAVHGRVRNPWNPDFISGGSSSGSAAAVASGSAAIALGSDTGGSLRIPAHCCGLTAWKPTYGIVSTRGAMALAPTLDTIGLLARSAADLEPGLDALGGDLPMLNPPISGAVIMRDAFGAAHPSVRKACQDGIEAIAASGIALTYNDGKTLIDSADGPALTVMQAEAARCHRHLLDEASINHVLRKRLAKGLDIDDAMLGVHIARRPTLAAAFVENLLGSAGVAVLPVMAIRTPRAAECDPEDALFSARTLYALSRYTRFVNMLGFPAVALPVGFDDRGMPVALQIVGRPRSDRALLRLAAAVQGMTSWHGRVPDAVSALRMHGDPPDIVYAA